MNSKVAIPIWQERISPVMDSAGQLMVLEFSEGTETARNIVPLSLMSMMQKADFIRGLGIETLICGAISHQLFRMLRASGIEIIPFIRGTANAVIEAFLNGNLSTGEFLLPGCGGRGRGRRRRNQGFGRDNF